MRKYYLPVFVAGLLALVFFSCTKRKPEEVDYAPNSPYNPYPPDSATNIDHTTLDVTLRWTATDPNSGDILTYAVYFDTLNPPLTQIASGLSVPSYFVDSLSYNTTYYWNLYITDDAGITTSGPVWRFTTLPHANTAPAVPTYLYPSDNASWQYPTLTFGWNCTDPEGDSDTLYYALYLGISPQPSVIPSKNDFALVREVSGLNYSTTYSWKIVARDNHYAYTSGSIYSFTTRDCPWFYKQELPSPRYGFGTAVVNGKIYVIGGTDSMNCLSEVLEYDPLLNTWTRKADMPTPRSNLAVTVWGNKIYAIGGSLDINALKNNNEVYDPALNTWSILTPAPASHFWTTANAVNDKIYFIGGTPTIGDPDLGIYEYSIAANAWWDTTIYYVYADTISLDSIIYGVDTIKSSLKSTPPEKRLFYCSAIYNDLIYMMGGVTKSGDYPPTVDVYHPETNEWTVARDMIGPVSAPAAVVANGFIYVIGGYDGTYSKRVRKYDLLADTWLIRCDLQTGRSSLGAAFINNRIYAIGGVALFPLATLEEYRIELDSKR